MQILKIFKHIADKKEIQEKSEKLKNSLIKQIQKKNSLLKINLIKIVE